MTTTVEILRQYNRWRRGDDTLPQPDPEQIGKAIDSACDEIERLTEALRLAVAASMGAEAEASSADHDYYPAVVCSSCGAKYGRRRCGVATWHAGKCGICGIDADVTDPRDFGHLYSDWRDRHKKESA